MRRRNEKRRKRWYETRCIASSSHNQKQQNVVQGCEVIIKFINWIGIGCGEFNVRTSSNFLHPRNDFTTSAKRILSFPDTNRTPLFSRPFVSVVATWGRATDQIGRDWDGTKAASIARVLCCVVLCGVVWCCVVWCGVVWCGVVWCGLVWCGARAGHEGKYIGGERSAR